MLHHTDQYGEGNTALRIITYCWRGQRVVSAIDCYTVIPLPPRVRQRQTKERGRRLADRYFRG